MASDHAWLWDRGYEGGGPQLELLRRLAHWMMKEPELEEETLAVVAEGQTMTITRRTLGDGVGSVAVTGPDGETASVTLEQTGPGTWTTIWDAPEIGLYRLKEGDVEAVIALGPAAPREFEQTIAASDRLDPALAAAGGGTLVLEAGAPDIRTVRSGRPAVGRAGSGSHRAALTGRWTSGSFRWLHPGCSWRWPRC